MGLSYKRRWEGRRSAKSAKAERPFGYYGLPVLHKPQWKWLIVVYFFVGGIAGAAYAIASIADLLGGPENRRIARAGRYVSFAALLPAPVLLILDLGRPERFWRMLSIVKLRSPMSVGSWTLAGFSLFSTLAAARQALDDGLLGSNALARLIARTVPRRTVGAIGLVPAFFLAGYTGVLLGATAVPLWARNALMLGPLFLASAVSTATAAIAAVLALGTRDRNELPRGIIRLERVALIAELGLLVAFRQRLGPVVGQPLREGFLGSLFGLGVVGLGGVLPLLAQALAHVRPGHEARRLALLGSLLTLVGGFLLRYIVVVAGRASADDPRATFVFAGGEVKK